MSPIETMHVEQHGSKELVMQAVKAEGLALLYAAKEMREDAEVESGGIIFG